MTWIPLDQYDACSIQTMFAADLITSFSVRKQNCITKSFPKRKLGEKRLKEIERRGRGSGDEKC
jgi:hypothetical protein